MFRIDVVTIFPQMFESAFRHGVIGQACKKNLLDFRFHNLRDFTTDKHQTVDDPPFGGGGGLIFKIEPLVRALRAIKDSSLKSRSILLTPHGELLSDPMGRELAVNYQQLILFCGRYEGVDERFLSYMDQAISIGDFIVSGGEIPAMVVMEVVSRFVPGVIGQEEAADRDSFSPENEGLLEHPNFTRPRSFEEKGVPPVLLSGHHEQILKWRKEQRLNITLQKRADLLQKAQLFDGVAEDYDGAKDKKSEHPTRV